LYEQQLAGGVPNCIKEKVLPSRRRRRLRTRPQNSNTTRWQQRLLLPVVLVKVEGVNSCSAERLIEHMYAIKVKTMESL
jgi:hypothetical protein